METTVEQLVSQAMTLPGELRARVVELLIESLNTDDFGAIERAWNLEAKRRRDEVRAGKVEPIPGDEALQDVRNSIS
jgi:Putative addiction module component